MILVDTSVLIDYLRGRSGPAVEAFDAVLRDGLPFGITPHVYMEILQGAATERDYGRLKRYLDTQTFHDLRHGRESYAQAARIYFECRRAGLTISSTVDCLIAQTAIENNLQLLQNDRDYVTIKRVESRLKLFALPGIAGT